MTDSELLIVSGLANRNARRSYAPRRAGEEEGVISPWLLAYCFDKLSVSGFGYIDLGKLGQLQKTPEHWFN